MTTGQVCLSKTLKVGRELVIWMSGEGVYQRERIYLASSKNSREVRME